MAASKKLKNEDFRKLLATNSIHHAAAAVADSSSHDASHAFTHHNRKAGATVIGKKKQQKNNYKPNRTDKKFEDNEKEDDIFDESEAKLNEILKNYRDRAAERRKALASNEIDVELKLMGENKEVAGSVLEASSMEGRKMQIQKSKYLGGDMEHTHLVKGLDYSLLNKVRSEIQEEGLSGRGHKMGEDIVQISSDASKSSNKLAKNICKILFESKPAQKNDLFIRGRMAYLIDMEEEEAEVPSTLLRSVCQTNMDQTSENINADNLLINKLSQVLAYLRTDVKKKKKGSDRNGIETEGHQYSQVETKDIFDGLDEYVPSKERKKREAEEKGKYSKTQQKSYFNSNQGRESRDEAKESSRERQRIERKRQHEDEEEKRRLAEKEDLLQKKKKKLEEEDAYAELYPGGLGMIDAGGESDEDDLTKMDQGNRKPHVKRWDFDSQEDFEKYQSQREANPRAAYQYGVKTTGGRKTRKNASAANERKIDRELEKINKILEKGVSQSIRY